MAQTTDYFSFLTETGKNFATVITQSFTFADFGR